MSLHIHRCFHHRVAYWLPMVIRFEEYDTIPCPRKLVIDNQLVCSPPVHFHNTVLVIIIPNWVVLIIIHPQESSPFFVVPQCHSILRSDVIGIRVFLYIMFVRIHTRVIHYILTRRKIGIYQFNTLTGWCPQGFFSIWEVSAPPPGSNIHPFLFYPEYCAGFRNCSYHPCSSKHPTHL